MARYSNSLSPNFSRQYFYLLSAGMDSGFTLHHTQQQSQQRLSNDLPQETVRIYWRVMKNYEELFWEGNETGSVIWIAISDQAKLSSTRKTKTVDLWCNFIFCIVVNNSVWLCSWMKLCYMVNPSGKIPVRRWELFFALRDRSVSTTGVIVLVSRLFRAFFILELQQLSLSV